MEAKRRPAAKERRINYFRGAGCQPAGFSVTNGRLATCPTTTLDSFDSPVPRAASKGSGAKDRYQNEEPRLSAGFFPILRLSMIARTTRFEERTS
jgi:hypothetical protein